MQLQEKHETSPMDRTAGDEGVGIREQLVRVPFNTGAMTSCALRRLQEKAECHSAEPFSTTFGKRADRWGGGRDGSCRGRRRQSGG